MTPEQEDALWDKCTKDAEGSDVERWRLAIRAAVAHERERAAKVCEEVNREDAESDRAPYDYGFPSACRSCAAAIRRGE